MKIIDIFEDNHGHIGTAISYKAAIHFLATKDWIEGDCVLYEYDETACKGKSILVQEKLGEDWVNNLLTNFDIDSFNELFDGWIELVEVEVYDKTFEKEN